MTVIVVSGLPGTGSSTAAKLLAERLELGYFSIGAYNKSHAEKFSGKKVEKETERSVVVWNTEEGSSKEFHEKSDDIAREKAMEGNVVIDAKLGIRMTEGYCDFSVWVKAPLDARAKRIAGRDNISVEEAKEILKKKEHLERDNWLRIYGFDYFDQEKEADMVIDTTDKTPDEIADAIIKEMMSMGII